MSNDAEPQKEIFHVAGDQPDPEGVDPRARGVSPGYNFANAASGRPLILYRMGSQEIFLEADVYDLPGAPAHILINCPWCLARGRQVGLRIAQDHKRFFYAANEPVPTFPGWSRSQMQQARPQGFGGRLTVEEPIACTWEGDPTGARANGVNGLSMCGWRVSIKDNVARDV